MGKIQLKWRKLIEAPRKKKYKELNVSNKIVKVELENIDKRTKGEHIIVV